MWDQGIRAKRASSLLPVLENVLAGFGKHAPQTTVTTLPETPTEPEEKPPAVLTPLIKKR